MGTGPLVHGARGRRTASGDATYSVVVSDFLLGGGDHQATGLGRGANPQPGPRVADAIRAHIASAGEGCRAVDAELRIDVVDCDPGQ